MFSESNCILSPYPRFQCTNHSLPSCKSWINWSIRTGIRGPITSRPPGAEGVLVRLPRVQWTSWGCHGLRVPKREGRGGGAGYLQSFPQCERYTEPKVCSKSFRKEGSLFYTHKKWLQARQTRFLLPRFLHCTPRLPASMLVMNLLPAFNQVLTSPIASRSPFPP